MSAESWDQSHVTKSLYALLLCLLSKDTLNLLPQNIHSLSSKDSEDQLGGSLSDSSSSGDWCLPARIPMALTPAYL